jgi:uncharacterized membrane protein YkvA (DUF1232 family)
MTPELEPFLAHDLAPPAARTPRLLRFYDRLRSRIVAYVEKDGGRLKPAAAEALLLVPDVFVLLLRLMADRDVPARDRALIGGALAYFILPVDLLPEAMLGAGGFIEDMVLALAVLAQTFGNELEPFAEKYWSGRRSLRRTLGDILGSANSLLSTNLYNKLRRALARRGIDLDEAAAESGAAGPSRR